MSLPTSDLLTEDAFYCDPANAHYHSHLDYREYVAIKLHEAREAEQRAALRMTASTVSRGFDASRFERPRQVRRPPPPTRRELYQKAKAAGLAVCWSGPQADDWDSLARKLKTAGVV